MWLGECHLSMTPVSIRRGYLCGIAAI